MISCPPNLSIAEQRDWAFARLEELTDELNAYRSIEHNEMDSAVSAEIGRRLEVSPQVVELLLALYKSNGRVVSSSSLCKNMTERRVNREEADINVVSVLVCKLRKVLWPEAIITTWGRGFSLSKNAIAMIDQIKADVLRSEPE